MERRKAVKRKREGEGQSKGREEAWVRQTGKAVDPRTERDFLTTALWTWKAK